MAREGDSEPFGMWEPGERRLMNLFGILLVVFFVVAAINTFLEGRMGMLSLGSDLVVAYAATSFLLGIVYVIKFRAKGIVPIGTLLRTTAKVAVIVAVFFTVMLIADIEGHIDSEVYQEDDPDAPELTPPRYAALVAGFLFLMFMAILVAELAILVGSFGMMGMLYMLELGLFPVLLLRLKGVTRRDDWKARALAGFMLIPMALDTDRLEAERPERETVFPWGRFRAALLWQVLFGMVIAIYISLNPFLLEEFSYDELLRFMSTAFVIVPFLVIPWFILLRLDARIIGANRDFHLYKALKDRVMRALLAFGTLLIFLRFAMEDYTIGQLMLNYARYTFIMVLFLVVFTFIYFNFYEDDLAEKMWKRWKEAEAEAEAETEAEAPDPGPEGRHGEDPVNDPAGP